MIEPETTALYVRIPATEAAKLDRAAFEVKAPKQDLIAGLLAAYLDVSSPKFLRELGDRGRAARGGTRRVTIESADDTLTVGRHSFLPAETPDVLTLDELAELLKADREAVEALAVAGELPGRRIGDEWRFSRAAVLAWLGGADAEPEPDDQ